MPKVEGTVTTPDDTHNRMDPEHVILTFTPEGGEPITVEYYYNKNVYKDPYDFVRTNDKVTVKYKADNPMNYIVYTETKVDYTKYIAWALIGGVFGFFIAKASDGSLLHKIGVFVITFVIAIIVCWIFYELDARFAWLNFNSKRRDDE